MVRSLVLGASLDALIAANQISSCEKNNTSLQKRRSVLLKDSLALGWRQWSVKEASAEASIATCEVGRDRGR
ncbi:hypothetical protein MUK42_10487 [Musa troglodytarum]|uniref:Secreted protein n=1 Tax=Musa troglodytarum TaxID=320322 RepID=A0A9E7GTT5_9LILI|nr:hypothetical protein MUK42_10487 [Musa troglodytarum]